jgi:hypothetical protein
LLNLQIIGLQKILEFISILLETQAGGQDPEWAGRAIEKKKGGGGQADTAPRVVECCSHRSMKDYRLKKLAPTG